MVGLGKQVGVGEVREGGREGGSEGAKEGREGERGREEKGSEGERSKRKIRGDISYAHVHCLWIHTCT